MMDEKEEDKEMLAVKKNTRVVKPIPKTQVGLNKHQKEILKSFIGKSPSPPVDLNRVRDWEKYDKD